MSNLIRNPLGDFLRVKEAAKFLGVSQMTLRRWDKRGKLKARRHPINGHRLYLPSELESLLAKVSQ